MATIETEFAGILASDSSAIADNVRFYQDGYDIIVNHTIAARGRKVVLGQKPELCRFCGRTKRAVTFKKVAHAVPELTGNRALISLYECDECNERFSAFEDDLGKSTLLERVAGQVLGKAGVPKATSGRRKSRISVGLTGFKIEEHADDSIVEFDHDNKKMTITVAPQTYRPLGVFKALLKIAVSLMENADLGQIPEVLKWLRASDLETDQVDDGTRYTCIRSWTPGPAPFANCRVIILRRKRDDVAGPFLVLLLVFGNVSFQIVVPAPRKDKHLIGTTVSLRAIPVFPLLDRDRVRGPTRYWSQDLSSRMPQTGSASVIFHYDSFSDATAAAQDNFEQDPVRDPDVSSSRGRDMIATLTRFLREAIKQVPSVRYAFGAAGIAAAGALITLFLGYRRTAIIVWIGTFGAMVLLLLFATAASSGSKALRQPALLLVHAVTLFFCLFLAFTVTAFAFSWPANWAAFLGIDLSSDVRKFSVLGDTVNFGCERGATSKVSYSVPPGYRLLNAHAETADVVGAKSASANVVSRDEQTATAKADFFGRDLEWTRNCPGGGHGRVRLSGDYVRQNPPAAVYASGVVVFSLAAAAAALALVPRRRKRS